MWPPAWLTPVDEESIARGDGDFIIRFAEAFGKITKDSVAGRAGTKLVLREWQKEILQRVFARDEDGGLTHRVSLVGIARKNGKSALGSIIAATGLMDVKTQGAEIYSVAADAPRHEGLSPTMVLFDELHAQPNRELFDVMSLAQGARGKAATLIAITTAGVKTENQTGNDSIAYSLYQYGQKVARGEIIDPTFFMAWYEAAAEADYRLEETWKQANPGFDDICAKTDFESAVLRTPEAEFRTKRCNQWVSSQSSWLPVGAWEDLAGEVEISPDEYYILGFDGSYANDSTAICVVTIPQDDEIPKVKLVKTWEKNFGVDDDSWRVPIEEVKQEIIKYVQNNPKVREIACDPFRWQSMMQELQDLGYPIVEYKTNLLNLMIPATQKVFEAVTEKRLVHDGNPALARHIENCVVKTDHRGPRITKESPNSKRKIDNAVAFVIAYDRATAGKLEEPLVPQFFV